MSWLSIALLACAVLVLIGAEWPRLADRLGSRGRGRRARARRKQALRVITSEQDEFASSVERDLSRLPIIEERDHHSK